MKTVVLSLAILLSLTVACSSSMKSGNRSPQQVAEQPSEEELKNEQAFIALMSNPTPEASARDFGKYLDRQLNYIFIAQGLLQQFDQELDAVHKAKMKNVDAEPDQRKLDQLRIKLNIVWEYYHEKTERLTHIYSRLRDEAAKNSSPYQKSATFALGSMQSYVDRAWKSGDHWALLTLIASLQAADEKLQETNPGQPTLAFMSFYTKKLNNQNEINSAKAQSVTFQKTRKKRALDRAFEKEWTTYLDQREKEVNAEKAADRQPNTDVLYPSPGGTGNITGNAFKPGFWAITFDDGPHPTHTMGMVNAMNSAGFEGTFYWLTQNMKKYPAIVAEVGKQGFKRASHSYTHANLPTLNQAGLNHEINEAYSGFADVVGQPPTFFRCPYGACGSNNSNIRQMIANKKMLHTFWNVDTLDWQDSDPQSIFQRAKKQMEVLNRGVVLFHDIHPQSVKAVQLLVNWISTQKTAWKVLNMEEMVREETADPNSPSKHYTSP